MVFIELLFRAMISSAMWYNQPDERIMQTLKVGLIKLNYKQFYVGFMSSVIVITPSMILVSMPLS